MRTGNDLSRFWNMLNCDVSNYLFVSRMVIDPAICNGSPVIRGTRITVQTVLEFLSAGDRPETILEEYPMLEMEDVMACLDYSSRLMKHHFSMKEVA